MYQHLYIKEESSLIDALVLAKKVSYAFISSVLGNGRVITTDNYNKVAYILATNNIYFRKY